MIQFFAAHIQGIEPKEPQTEAGNTKLLLHPTPQIHLTFNLNPSAKAVNNAALRLNHIVLIINEAIY
jgi:hypothetical protein